MAARDGNQELFFQTTASQYSNFLELECQRKTTHYSVDMDMTFIFIVPKEESTIVKFKLHPEWKQPHYAANTTSSAQTAC